MHDPAIGRFMQIDPLSEKYVYNSTYAFSENRVIDGLEFEGLEHVNANLARLIIRRDGTVNLNMQRMSNPNKNGFNWKNSDPANWSGGNMGASYLNTKVGEFSFGSLQRKYATLGGFRSSTTEIISSTAEKTGQAYNQNRNFIGNGSLVGGQQVKAAKAMLAIEGVRIGFQMLFFGFNEYDKYKTNQQLELLGLAANDLSRALLDGGIIPEDNLNIDDLSTILQVIFSGENSSGDESLTIVGLHIYNIYNNDDSENDDTEFWRKESERIEKLWNSYR